MQAPLSRLDAMEFTAPVQGQRAPGASERHGLALGDLIRELDGQLTAIAGTMRSRLKRQQELRATLLRLTDLHSRLSPESPEANALRSQIETTQSEMEALNGNQEITLLAVQSISEQRKNALSLLSNLLAASAEVAKAIIANVRP